MPFQAASDKARLSTAPWWGEGAAPEERWPGCALAIPAVWAESQWEDATGMYWFDVVAADFAEQFFPACLEHHIGNEWNGRPFDLMPYQRVIVRALFGWKRVDGLRRFRKVFLAVPKGNGKSPFAAGLGLYLAFFDGEAGAEVYAVAADRKQAGIVFDSAKVFVTRNATWVNRFDVLRDSIRAAGSTECFQVLSSDASTKHGFRPHGIVFDEFHAQPNRDLFDTLYRGMGKRLQPVLVMITTAGNDDESICFEEWEYARSVLTGTIKDPTYLPLIFEARPEEDWAAEATWRRVNPGYGITMKEDYFHTESAAAQVEPRKRNSFLQLHTNRWTNQATAWIPVDWWDACAKSLPPDVELRDCPCAVGIDMAQKIDLAAAVVGFRLPLEDGAAEPLRVEASAEDDAGVVVKRTYSLDFRVALVPAFWLPEETLQERVRQDRVPYDLWAHEKLLHVVDGAIMSADAIVQYVVGRDGRSGLLERFPRLKAAQFAYDPAFATEIALALRDRYGFTTVEVLQNYKHLSEACQVFEALVKAKRIIHGGHRLLRWNLENVAIKQDDAGRMRPVKPKRAAKRIDGIVASIMAISRLMLMPPERKRRRRAPSVWTLEGFKAIVSVDALQPSDGGVRT